MSEIDKSERPRDKVPYEPPAIVATAEFETLALSCGKVAGGGGGPLCNVINPKLS